MATNTFLPSLDRPALPPLPVLGGGQKAGFLGTFADAFGGIFGPAQGKPAAPAMTDPKPFMGLGSRMGERPTLGFGGGLPGLGGLGSPSFGRPSLRMPSRPMSSFAPLPGLGTTPTSSTQPAGGMATTVGGKWAALDVHNPEIMAAASGRGVPANLLKSMVNRESSGNWDANNYINTAYRGQRMLPFVGIFESTAASWGMDFNSLVGNKAAQIDAMAVILAGLKAQYWTWERATLVYFGGPKALQPGGFTDELGMNSSYYGQVAINDWQELDRLGGSTGFNSGVWYGAPGSSPANPGVGGSWWSPSIWGNVPATVSYEFGADSVNGDMYLYGAAHGTSGWVHPGVDVSLPYGTTLYTPQAGTVSCVGTADAGLGGTGGGSCGYFGDTDGGGVGNVTIKFDDGSYLVFGHSSAALAQVGQRVSAGQAVARSGGMKGAHAHFEYRVPGPCSSGYCVKDPRGLTGGATGGATGQPAGQAPAQTGYSSDGARYASYATRRPMLPYSAVRPASGYGGGRPIY